MPQIDQTKTLLPNAQTLRVPLLEVLSEGPYLAKVFRPSGTQSQGSSCPWPGRFRRFFGLASPDPPRSNPFDVQEDLPPGESILPMVDRYRHHAKPHHSQWPGCDLAKQCCQRYHGLPQPLRRPTRDQPHHRESVDSSPLQRRRSKEQSEWQRANRVHRPWIHESSAKPNHRPPRLAP